jgi:hypothetical protein
MNDQQPSKVSTDFFSQPFPHVLENLSANHRNSNSSKSPTRCNNFSSLLSCRLFTVQHVSGILTPIIRSATTAVAAYGFTFGAW